MNIFQNYKATKRYLEILDNLEGEDQKKRFGAMVKAKFYDKVTSDEELDAYTITESDLDKIASRILNLPVEDLPF